MSSKRKTIKLREWQALASDGATEAFAPYLDPRLPESEWPKERKLWVTEACTGAGKTRHGREVALRLLGYTISAEAKEAFEKRGLEPPEQGVDLVIILTPSVATRSGWKSVFDEARKEGKPANPTDSTDFPRDTNVWVTTYSGYEAVIKALEGRPTGKGFLLIADEYHHAEQDAHWGNAVERLGGMARHVLFLSGTPWRRSGIIPLLASHTNVHGQPYYVDGSTRVQPDYVHDYKEDLRSGPERATTPIHFELFESIYTSRDGEVQQLTRPDFDAMSEDEQAVWDEAAVRDKTPLGKHVRVGSPTLRENALARAIVDWGVQMLEQSRREARAACGLNKLTVMLVVAQNIKEARYLADYIAEVHNLRTEVIVSENVAANEHLERVREQCARNDIDMPDVIVSVGMISEGVDIPQIKVICYLSAILTTLYLIQVIGRALRRMFVPATGQFADSSIYDTPAYFAGPAHPKICYIAKQIEEAMEDLPAERSSDGDGGEGPPPTEQEPGTVSTTDETLSLFRGQEDGATWRRVIQAMADNPKAGKCFLNSAWCDYVLSLALGGLEEGRQRAQAMAAEMCQCLELDFKNVWNEVSTIAGRELTYDQEQQLLRKQAQYLTNLLRWRHPRYAAIEENDRAYMTVRADINKLAGLNGTSFPKASLEEKRRWIDCAQRLLNEVGREAAAV